MAIKIIPIVCPKCNASIQIDTTRDFCYCTYCGTKLYVDDDSIKTITINYNHNYTKTDKAKIRKIEAEEHIREMEYAHANKKQSNKFKMALLEWIFIILILVGCYAALMSIGYEEKKEQEKQIAYFEQLVTEIEQDIADGNYTEARNKANKIQYTANYSSDEEKKWNKTRKRLLKEIDYAENGKTPIDEVIDHFFE